MPAFTFDNTGIFPEEIDAILEFVGHWEEDAGTEARRNLDLDLSRIDGDPKNGNTVFHRSESCASCHGVNGMGDETAAQLNNQDFLAIATDSYIEATVLSNRMNIPNMPSDAEISDVIAYVRSWQDSK